MISVTHKRLIQILDQLQTPAFIHGTFGIGKTQSVREYAKTLAKRKGLEFSEEVGDINNPNKFLLIRLPLHQLELGELKGIPFPSPERDRTIFLPMGLLPIEGEGILFLDEMNLASPAMQGNAYQLVLDRRLGFYKLPDGYKVLAAGNTSEDGAYIFDMPRPLRARFAHLKLAVPTVEEWSQWAAEEGIDPRIIAFLLWRKDYLFTYTPDMSEEIFAMPCPRTWEFVSKSIKGLKDLSLVRDLTGSLVGEGVANEFVAWIQLSESYDIEEIFKKKKVTVPKKVDVLYSLLSAIVGHYNDAPAQEKANALFDLAFQFEREHTLTMLSMVAKRDKEFFKKVDPSKMDEKAEEIITLLT